MTQQARQLTWTLAEQPERFRFLIRDRDQKFTDSFDEVFRSHGMEIIRTPFRAPQANGVAERFVRAVRSECLDWLLIVNQQHLERALTVFADHDNGHRPHRALARAAWLDGRRDPGTPPHTNAGGDYDPMHLMFATGSADGRWHAETGLATNVCGCCKTAIATGRDGSVYVAFRNIYPGSLRDIAFTMSHDGGRTFSPPVRVSEDHWMLDGCPDDGATMALDRHGVVHLVWPTLVQGAQPAIALFHASTRDGVTFTPRQRIETLDTPKPSHPQLTADACGALTLVWDETQGSTRRALMRQLTPLPSGDVRAGELHVMSGAHSAVYPVVAPTSNGLVAAWTDIDRTNGDQSDIALRPIALDETCEVPRDAAARMSIATKAIESPAPTQRYTLRGARRLARQSWQDRHG